MAAPSTAHLRRRHRYLAAERAEASVYTAPPCRPARRRGARDPARARRRRGAPRAALARPAGRPGGLAAAGSRHRGSRIPRAALRLGVRAALAQRAESRSPAAGGRRRSAIMAGGASPQVRAEVGHQVVARGVHDDVGREHGPLGHRDAGDGGLGDVGVAAQVRLDLAGVDTDAVDLHLGVEASRVVEQALLVLADQVAGAVPALAVEHREPLSGGVREADVAASEVRAGDEQPPSSVTRCRTCPSGRPIGASGPPRSAACVMRAVSVAP